MGVKFEPPIRRGEDWVLRPQPFYFLKFAASEYESRIEPLRYGEDYKIERVGSISIAVALLFKSEEDAMWAYLRL